MTPPPETPEQRFPLWVREQPLARRLFLLQRVLAQIDRGVTPLDPLTGDVAWAAHLFPALLLHCQQIAHGEIVTTQYYMTCRSRMTAADQAELDDYVQVSIVPQLLAIPC